MIAIAAQCRTQEGWEFWCPPTGRPYWTFGPMCPPHSTGPCLTDDELRKYGLEPTHETQMD